MTGVEGERKTEQGIPRHTNRHPGKCRVSAEDGDKDSRKARKTESQPILRQKKYRQTQS